MSVPAATASDQLPITFHEGRLFRLSGLTPHDKELLRDMLTIANPRRMRSLRFSGMVNADEPKEFQGYEDLPGDEMLIAPGAAHAVWKQFVGNRRLVQYRDIPRIADSLDLSYCGQSRDYQDGVVEALLARSHAVAVGPCGCGKTDIAIRVQVARACPWLIIVHKRKLLKQWKERLEERVGAPVSIYATMRKRRWDPHAPFVIATAQGLRGHLADVAALAGEGRGVWVDECHHTPCSTFTEVLAAGAWRYRYGVTATPDRTDGTTALMHWWIGPVVAKIPREQVEESGHLLRARLVTVQTEYRDTYDPDEPGDSARLMERLCANRCRRELVSAVIHGMYMQGRHILVCVDRIDYGEKILLDLTQKYKIYALICHSKLPKAEQDFAMEQVAGDRCRVVIATSLADEGLDLPILDTVVLATPSGSSTQVEQRMGRACRPADNKLEPLVVDIIDALVSRVDDSGKTHRVFASQFLRRYYGVYRKVAHVDPSYIKKMAAAWRNSA